MRLSTPRHLWLVFLLLFLPAGCDDLPMGPAEVRGQPVRAITLADWTSDGYGLPSTVNEIQALATSGANQMWIIVTGYQDNASATSIVNASGRTPTVEAVRVAAEAAQGLGLEVVLKPHVDVDDGSWRGEIEPTNVNAWFQSYEDFLLPWAALAEDLGAAHFIVGTELAKTVQHESSWRETIRRARQMFSGSLTYAASWDEANRIGFWDALEAVGVNAFFPLTDRSDPSRFEILAGWQLWLDRLEMLHQQTDRPLLLTEIGYRSVDGAGMHPYRFSDESPVDLQEQADLYWAALQATGDQDWIHGLVWWNWLARESPGAAARDFTPSGKPAMNELQAAWREL